MQLQKPREKKRKPKQKPTETSNLSNNAVQLKPSAPLSDVSGDKTLQTEIDPSVWDALDTNPETQIYPLIADFDILAPSNPIQQIVFPTAPPIYEDFVDLKQDLELDSTTELLDNIYSNPMETEHLEIIADFRSFSLGGSNNDDFHDKIQRYNYYYNEMVSIKAKMRNLQSETAALISRIWSLSKVFDQVSGNCQHSWTGLVHRFSNETAIYSEEIEKELVKTQQEIKYHLLELFPRASFDCKIARLWIQNEIDQLIGGEFADHLLQRHNFPFGTSLAQFETALQTICHYLDVLFHFVKKINSVENHFQTDIHNWINSLAVPLSMAGNYYHHRHLLLHSLRCKGISKWANNFIQWPTPKEYTEVFINHYLVSLGALLGPVEEIEEALSQIKFDVADKDVPVNEHGNEWILLEEPVFNMAKLTDSPVILEEIDYIFLIRQFNVPAIFEYIVNYHFSSYYPGSDSATLLKPFIFGNKLLQILERSCHVFPYTYVECYKAIAQLLTVCNKLLSTAVGKLGSSRATILSVQSGSETFKTTAQIQMDIYIVRSIKIIIKKPGHSMWQYFSMLPLESVSKNSIAKLYDEVIEGSLFDSLHSEDEHLLIGYLLRSGLDAVEYLPFLQRLASHIVTQNNLIPYQKAISACFQVCFRASDLRDLLFDSAKHALANIVLEYPELISCLLNEFRVSFSLYEEFAFNVFKELDIKNWIPQLEDIQLLGNMLKDPLNSKKSKLARYIIDQVDWQKMVNGTLCIDRLSQRQLSILLVNIYLDQVWKTKSQTPLYTSVAQKGLQVATSVLSASPYKSEVTIFVDWLWITLERLQLYIKPNFSNNYALTDKYECFAIDGVTLATLRSNINDEPISAYIYLMLSELGHNFESFDTQGWAILSLIIKNGKFVAFLIGTFELFETLTSQAGNQFFESKNFNDMAYLFWSYNRDLTDDIDIFFSRIENSSLRYAILYCTSLIFAYKGWNTCKNCLIMLDKLSKKAIEMHEFDYLSSRLEIQYRMLLDAYNTPKSKPISALYSIATTSFGSQFPSLIDTKDWLFLKTTTNSEFLYFCFVALYVETRCESEIRHLVGNELSAGKKFEQIQSLVKKPFESFAINGWIKRLIEIPSDSDIIIKYWQAFFTLFFERYGRSIFGRLFLPELSIINLIEKAQSTLISLDGAGLISAEVKGLFGECIQQLSSKDRAESSTRTNAARNLLLDDCFISDCWWTVKSSVEPQISTCETALKNDMSISVDPPLPVANFSPRNPLIIGDISSRDALPILTKDLDRLIKKSKNVETIANQILNLDEMLITDLKALYKNLKKRGVTRQKCSLKNCTGILLEYDYSEASIDREISEKIHSNRASYSAHFSNDPVDNLTCACGLKMVKILNQLEKKDIDDFQQDFLRFFYDCLDVLLDNSIDYPPLKFIISEIVTKIGNCIIVSKKSEIERIFQTLMKKQHVDLLIPLFDPLCIPEQFVDYYSRLSENTPEACIAFNVKGFSEIANEQEKMNLMKLLINLCNSQCVIHQEKLIDLLKHNSEKMVPIALENILDGIISKTYQVVLVKVFRAFIFEVTNVPVQNMIIYLDGVIRVLEHCDDEKLKSLDIERRMSIFDLYIAMSNAKELFGGTEQQLQLEIWYKATKFSCQILCGYNAEDHKFFESAFKDLSDLTSRICQQLHLEFTVYILKLYCILVKSLECNLLAVFEQNLQKLDWSSFEIENSFFAEINSWEISSKTQRNLLVEICKTGRWNITPSYLANYQILWFILHTFLDESDDFQKSYETFLFFVGIIQELSLCDISDDQCRQLYNQLPKTWNGSVSSIECFQEDNCKPLSMCLSLLRILKTENENTAQKLYIEYLVDLLSKQTENSIRKDILSVKSHAFDEGKIDEITLQVLETCESMPEASFELCCKKMLGLLNTCSKEDSIYTKLFKGVSKAINNSKMPLVYLDQACRALVSSETMALLCEISIENWLVISPGPQCWKQIGDILLVPELDETSFIRHCLSHCLVYTLYAHVLQKISMAKGKLELEILIGEQLGVWIESLKVDSVPTEKKNKVTLMITLFSHLLNKELNHLEGSENLSRLRAHLPPIVDVLFRWAEESQPTIWKTLGYGSNSKISPEFKFYCRLTATFIAIHILTDSASKTKLLGDFIALEAHEEYGNLVLYFQEATMVLKDDTKSLEYLSELLKWENRNFFPSEPCFLPQ